MGNANTEHSRRLRAASARRAQQKALEEGRIKQKTLRAPPEVIDEFLAHMDATGETTDAKKLAKINGMLVLLLGKR